MSSSASKKRAAAEELPAAAPPTDRHKALLAERKITADKLVQWASELPAQNLVPDPRFAVDFDRFYAETQESKRARILQYAEATSFTQDDANAANLRMARFLAVLLSKYTMMIDFAQFRDKLFLSYDMFQRATDGAEFCIVINHLEKSVMWLVLIVLHATVHDSKFKGVWRRPSVIMLGMDHDLKSFLKASQMPCVYIDDGSFGGGQLQQLVNNLSGLNLHAVIPYMTRRAKEFREIRSQCVLHTAVEFPSFSFVFDRILETRCEMYPKDKRFDDFKTVIKQKHAKEARSSALAAASSAGAAASSSAASATVPILTESEETLFYEQDVPFLYSLLYPKGYALHFTVFHVQDVAVGLRSIWKEENVEGKYFCDINPNSRWYVNRMMSRASSTPRVPAETDRVVDDATAKKHVLELIRFVRLWNHLGDYLDKNYGVRALALFEHRIADHASVPSAFFNFIFRNPDDPPTRDSYAVFLREKKAELEAILGAEYDELDHVGVGAVGDLEKPDRPSETPTVLARLQSALDRLKVQ